MKFVFVFDHFGPYHDARVGAVAAKCLVEIIGVELHAISNTYGWEPAEGRTCAFRKISLPRVNLRGRAERSALRPHLERVLEECKPDVVFVNGWGDFMSLETIRWAKKRGLRVVVMSETRRVDGDRSWWGEWVKSRIVSLCDAGLCGGKLHRRYLEELGLSKERVALGYNAVDNQFFEEIGSARGEMREGESKQLGAGSLEQGALVSGHSTLVTSLSTPDTESEALEGPYFLASNRFVRRKNLVRLIRAYAKYVEAEVSGRSRMANRGGEVWPLVLLGDGELRGELIARCVELGLGWKIYDSKSRMRNRDCDGEVSHGRMEHSEHDLLKINSYKLKTLSQAGLVVFSGFRQIWELRDFYSRAGAFIHPALSEPWGLVINEAMASGLPILSSNNVGAADELVRDGINGFSFDPEDVEELAELMLRLAVLPPEDRQAMGEASQRLIAGWGLERFVQGANEAARVAMAESAKRAGFLDRVLLAVLMLR